jgi:regulator of sirC expression with transglutaminase-like and TPR domain
MSPYLDQFAELVSRDQFDLTRASLLLAQDAYPAVDIPACLGQIEDMAQQIAGRISPDAFATQKLQALNQYLFAEQGYSGNVDNYYDPRNSYLNQVLERRVGIPITLSVLYLEIARRIGLDLKGVSFPGHFMVKLNAERGLLVLDPFSGGEAQSEVELRQRLSRVMPEADAKRAPLAPFLESATPRQIVARMLRNLKGIYSQAGQHEHALAVMHRILLVMPESVEELRDRGIIYEKLECFRPALSDLQNYLRRRPDAPDAGQMREKIVQLRQSASRLN